jgi:glycosidase
MKAIVLYWASKGVDGFRCDMAGMVPIEFWHWLTGEVRQKHPHVMFIAEVYETHLYNDFIFKGGFDFLYDKMVLYDGLRAISEGKAPAHHITNIWQQTEGLHHFLLYFLENHDEPRLASDFFAGNGLKGIPAMTVAATMFNNPVLIYSGQELGEKGMNSEGFSGKDGRTTMFDYWGLELNNHWRGNGAWKESALLPENRVIREFYTRLLNLLQEKPALHKGRFYDLMWANKDNPFFDTDKLYSFIRYNEGKVLIIIANFSDQAISYKLKIPADTMQTVGLNPDLFYFGKDLLHFCKPIQFPGVVATNAGFGGWINAHSAAIYRLKSEGE